MNTYKKITFIILEEYLQFLFSIFPLYSLYVLSLYFMTDNYFKLVFIL